MEPFTYCAEWIVAKLSEIKVERFVGWRRTGKRRLFQPFAILNIGQYQVSLDGKSAVWDFIDAIQPNMPRAVVNQGMKGEFVYEQTFAQDLQDFIDESEFDLCVFHCAHTSVQEPNTSAIFTGYTSLSVKAQNSPPTILTPPKSWGESMTVNLPMRMRTGEIKWLPSLVVGDYPRLVVAQSLSESKDFDMESSVLISSLVVGQDGCADVRPSLTIKRDEATTIIDALAKVHHALCDSDYNPYPCAYLRRNERSGMTFSERDSFEHERSEKLFFQGL